MTGQKALVNLSRNLEEAGKPKFKIGELVYVIKENMTAVVGGLRLKENIWVYFLLQTRLGYKGFYGLTSRIDGEREFEQGHLMKLDEYVEREKQYIESFSRMIEPTQVEEVKS
jgi:hypothetical protein